MAFSTDSPPYSPNQVTSSANGSNTQTRLQVADLDHDSLPDIVDLRNGQARVLYTGRNVNPQGIGFAYDPGRFVLG